MPETVERDTEAEKFSVKDLEETFERDLEKFKRKVDQLFSE
jgi:hypothetical protein